MASDAGMGCVSVLLTGGPGAGKSSALATLRDRLSKRGFQVLVVPEGATALLDNSGGYDPSWHGSQQHIELQENFLRFQVDHENAYRRLARLRPGKPHVILHDRGSLDGRLFCTDEQWDKVLAGAGFAEDDLLRRYDLVIHMTSVASGMEHLYDYGPGSSNPARYHTAEQARSSDLLAQKVYSKHPQIRVVPNFSDFSQKIQSVVSYVTEAVQVDGLAGPRERLGVPDADPVAILVWPVEAETYKIKVTFLDEEFTESVRCSSLVPPAGAGHWVDGAAATMASEQPAELYEHRKEIRLGGPSGQSICTRRVLSAEAFNLLKQQKEHARDPVEVGKRSICFTWLGNYYELISYSSADGGPLPDTWGLHGCHVLDKAVGAAVPPWIPVEGVGLGEDGRASPPEDAAQTTPPSHSPPPRKLSRYATLEAASSVEKFLREDAKKRARTTPAAAPASPARRLRRRGSKPAEELLLSPSLSKAAASAMAWTPERVR